MRISVKNLIPGGGKLEGIYKGVIEDNKDPEKGGRVRVRIIGVHTNVKDSSDTIGIPTESLPWVEPVSPIFEGAISGFGVWSVPVQGSYVYLFFESGNILQPKYFAACAGIPKRKSDAKRGFCDPDEEYPLEELLNEPDWNRLARDKPEDTVVSRRKETKLEDVHTAKGDFWSEPDPYYYESEEKYPHNIVVATHGGMVFEIDRTFPRATTPWLR